MCTIGGNVAENSGGAHCFKYGFTTNYVHRARGRARRRRASSRSAATSSTRPGYDLLGAFVGSEGTLGIATKIWLRVVPGPGGGRARSSRSSTPPVEAGEAVSAIVQAGIVPGRDRDDGRGDDRRQPSRWPTPATRSGRGAALLVELDGAERRVRGAASTRSSAICGECGSDDVRVSRDEAERALFWKTRKAAFPAMGRISPNYFVQDGVIPRTKLPEVLDRDRGARRRVRPAPSPTSSTPATATCTRWSATTAAIEGEADAGRGAVRPRSSTSCLDAGGSITGEHGVGVDKRKHMPKMFAEADLDAFQRLRCAFDPAGLANPGKVMPTPRLCGEVPGPYRQHPLEAAGLAERF